jgi:hypothetical protein
MGTYKVIQDIEAEDKLLGPLSLRQFIYAVIVIVSLFIGFRLLTAPSTIAKAMTVILIPHTIFFAVLAAPFGHDQSNEIWLLAKVRFFFKPRKRIWDQTGMKELVTITAPKVVEKQLTKDFSREEARNRLQALANTLDTRGWAVKNVGVNMFNQPAVQMPMTPMYNNSMAAPTDRLVNVSTADPVAASNDIATPFDDLDSEVAKSFSEHIAKTKAAQKEQVARLMHIPTPDEAVATVEDDNIDWFTPEVPVEEPLPKVMEKLGETNSKTKPMTNQNTSAQKTEDSSAKTGPDTVIIDPANNNDLSVATLQRRAVKDDKDDGEVVISLR